MDRDGKVAAVLGVTRDITESKRKEESLRHLSRAREMLSDCNQILIHASDEESLINDICRIIIEIGDYRFAWVGFVDP